MLQVVYQVQACVSYRSSSVEAIRGAIRLRHGDAVNSGAAEETCSFIKLVKLY